jgi:hypothetical protein
MDNQVSWIYYMGLTHASIQDETEQNVGPKPPTVRFEMDALVGGGSVKIGVRRNQYPRPKR